MPGHARRRGFRPVRVPRAPAQRRLYSAPDHGAAVSLDPVLFAPGARERGWGPFAESFLSLNRHALEALDVCPEIGAGRGGTILRLQPGGKTGAVPLRSAQSGHVVSGFVVRPRFGWSGVGAVLGEIGWNASPRFLDLPLVPGSGREVPPWVLAGPVLARLVALMESLRPGYRDAEAVLRRARGRILWDRYRHESFVRGRWDRLPCRYPELETDPRLRRIVRWSLERIHGDLVSVGARDTVSMALASVAIRLLERLADVSALAPGRDDLRLTEAAAGIADSALKRGIEAIGWIVEERGLGGGRELDGLAWQLPLDQLWESYVEAVVRRETALVGGDVKVARLGETTFPLAWTDPTHRSLGHLSPDIVVRRGRSVHIFDAKYKSHLAELDDSGWRRFTDDLREQHRADLHQILAYAALYDADDLAATLVYPLRHETWHVLKLRGRDTSAAELLHGGRRVRLELRGLPFGTPRAAGTGEGSGSKFLG